MIEKSKYFNSFKDYTILFDYRILFEAKYINITLTFQISIDRVISKKIKNRVYTRYFMTDASTNYRDNCSNIVNYYKSITNYFLLMIK